MLWRNVGLVYRKEMQDMVRDRRTLFIMTILPILLWPVLMVGMLMIAQVQISRLARERSVVAVIGAVQAPDLVAQFTAASLSAIATESVADVSSVQQAPDDGQAQADGVRPQVLRQIAVEHVAGYTADLKQKMLDKEIALIVEIPANFADILAQGDAATLGAAHIRLWYDSAQEKSMMVKATITGQIERYKNDFFRNRLQAAAIPAAYLESAVAETDVGAEAALLGGKGGNALARLISFFILSMALTGAFYPAIDISAGEKERGTMETLLITPAARVELVAGKFAAVFTLALVSTLLNVASLGLTFSQLPQWLNAPVASQVTFENGLLILFYMLLILVPLVGLFSALSLAISTFARSFKEGQNYLSPLITVSFLVSMIGFLPGFELTPGLCFVPVASAALLFQDLFANNFSWVHVALIFGSTLLYSIIAVQWTASLYEKEEVLFRESDEINWQFWIRTGRQRPILSVAEALMVYGMVMAVFFLASSRIRIEMLAPSLIILHGLVVLGIPLAMLRVLHVDWRGALQWRRVPPRSWALLIPFGLASFTAARLAVLWQFQQNSLPPSNEAMEQLEKAITALTVDHTALAIFVIGVLPAISEEILCRGVLLSSLRRAMGSGWAVVVAAVLFGLLHMNLYQFLHATLLGMALGALVVRTGSIFPAMLAHALNNGGIVLYVTYKDRLNHAGETMPTWLAHWDWLLAPEPGNTAGAALPWLAQQPLIGMGLAALTAAACYHLIPKTSTTA